MDESRWGKLLMFTGVIITIVSAGVKIAIDYECVGCSYLPYMIIWFIAGSMVAVGFLLWRSKELHETIKESQLKINKEFIKAKEKERAKEEFVKFLDGFKKDEIEVIEFLHTFEGIQKAELGKKVSISTAKLEKILQKLEKDDVISMMGEKCYLKVLSK